jgi:hypothetical protein
MSDPRRLVEDDATALERLLLDAVRREAPRPEVSRRMRRGLGLGTLAGAAATIAPATAVAKAATSLWVVLGVAVMVGAGTVGLHLARTAAAPAKVPTGTVAPATTAPADRAVPVPPTDETAVTASELGNATALADEVRRIDAARAAMDAHEGERALGELREYFVRYPAGVLEPEAATLRVEALRATGRLTQAEKAARAFLLRHPDSPLAERVRGGRVKR